MFKQRLPSFVVVALSVVGMWAMAGCSTGHVPASADLPAATAPPDAIPTPLSTAETESDEIATATVAASDTHELPSAEPSGGMLMRLTSTAFEDGDLIPKLYTCDGQDISPPLTWQDVPAEAQSFALVCDDPDAPGRTWVHWVMYNIPSEARSLPEKVVPQPVLPDGTQQGRNSWPRTGYGGPCPPSGTHRYIFKLYALDVDLDLAPADTDKAALLEAMEGHVLAETMLTGLYKRQR